MLPLRRWPKATFHSLCAECWDRNSGEHPHKETKRSEIEPLSYISQRRRDARNKKTQSLLSRPGPEFSAQRPNGTKKPAEKGGV